MKTVLIIDDEPDYRKLLSEILQADGWQVFASGKGEEGIELAKAHQPAVVLCDLLMPRCNGLQVCRALRAHESLRNTKIVVASGRDSSSDRCAAMEAGANEYLTKPVDIGQLVQLLSRLVTPAPSVTQAQTDPHPQKSSHTFVKFWGVRGSIPTPGPGTVLYGGNTSCVEVRSGGQIIILDAGTGVRLLGHSLVSEFKGQPLELTLLLTHTHWDHIQGLPFFLPLYEPQNRLRILGYEGARQGLHEVLFSQMERPFFPIGLREVPANICIEELKETDFCLGPVRVQACFANHPGICVGYKLTTSEGSIAFFPDNEPHQGQRRSGQPGSGSPGGALKVDRSQDQKIVDFLRHTDVLIMDSQYDREEYQHHVGWGHGCLDDVVALALDAQVKKLFLFHHDPNHDDAKVSQMLAYARDLVAVQKSALQVEAAQEGSTVQLSSSQNRP